jgi:fatty acid desaturase
MPYLALETAKNALASKVAWTAASDEGELFLVLGLALQEYFAETPLWTIHGKAYDLSSFIALHPGGEEWIRMSASRDATTLFETTHVRIKLARKALGRYHAPGAPVALPSQSDKYAWDPAGLHATLRDRVAEALVANILGDSSADTSVSDATKVNWTVWKQATDPTASFKTARALGLLLYMAAFMALLWARTASSAVAFGALTAVMGGFGHNALHSRGKRWDSYLFECAGMSHRVYRLGHVMGHHCVPNTDHDPDATSLKPFISYEPVPRDGDGATSCESSGVSLLKQAIWEQPQSEFRTGDERGSPASRWFRATLSPLYWHLIAAGGSIFIFMGNSCLALARLLISIRVFLGWRRARPPQSASEAVFEQYDGWVPLFTLLCLFISSGSEVCATAPVATALENVTLWITAWVTGSLYFMLITTVTHNQVRNWATTTTEGGNDDGSACPGRRRSEPANDWIQRQLEVSSDIAVPWFLGGERLRGSPICSMWLLFLHEQSLHHLFPTVDVSRLHSLRPLVKETCREFGVVLPAPQPWRMLYLGMLKVISGRY